MAGINYNGGKSVGCSCNAAGEFVQMDDWTGTTAYSYDGMRSVARMEYPDGWSEGYAYDSAGRLLSICDNDRLSVNVTGVGNGAGHIMEGGEIRLYYHMDIRGTADYLTSPISKKVESWTHYNEWGEITHNVLVKTSQREFDMVKRYAPHDYDQVLGLYYAKARFYDAANRHFAAMDQILDPNCYDLRLCLQPEQARPIPYDVKGGFMKSIIILILAITLKRPYIDRDTVIYAMFDEFVYLTKEALTIIDYEIDTIIPKLQKKENYELTIRNIDNRVSWIDEHIYCYLDDGEEAFGQEQIRCVLNQGYRDYIYNNKMIYRRGTVNYYFKIGGGIVCDLYYDNEGFLIFAEVAQYRDSTYCIYFINDKLLRISKGEKWYKKENVLDYKMVNAINVCLKNAYR